MKYFILLIIVTVLFPIRVSAQVKVKTLQLPIKVAQRSPNIRKKACQYTFEAETAELVRGSSMAADLFITGVRQAQQVVCKVAGLTPGKHAISIVNRGPGPVAIDALIVK